MLPFGIPERQALNDSFGEFNLGQQSMIALRLKTCGYFQVRSDGEKVSGSVFCTDEQKIACSLRQLQKWTVFMFCVFSLKIAGQI